MIKTLITVFNPQKWNFQIPGVQVISTKEYLLNVEFLGHKGRKVINLSDSYRYQSLGYYVSLLAVARGHRIFPNINTIMEMSSKSHARFLAQTIDEEIQKSLKGIQSEEFIISIYFGRNLARKYDRLANLFFNMFPAPLMRASFVQKKGKWFFQDIDLVGIKDIPKDHIPYVQEHAQYYFAHKTYSRKKTPAPFDMGILLNEKETYPPSDKKSIKNFTQAAKEVGFSVELISKEDFNKLPQYDALFIRETTAVNHHTFRFSQRATAEGLVVIDDPQSIIKCTNKVYLAETLRNNKIATPPTYILNVENARKMENSLTYPIILKQPDSSFSQGVYKVETAEEYKEKTDQMFRTSDLIIAQNFIPTDFDWRVGVLNNEILFVCKYHMAKNHWQVINWAKKGKDMNGIGETIPTDQAPREIIRAALKSTQLIGNGLYGVDIKEYNNKCYVIEINDNPSLDSGVEDQILKQELYLRIMNFFLQQVKKRKGLLE